MISLRGVSRTYPVGGGLTVLRGVDLDIAKGEYVGILGPSGSGKSTLLHILGLLDRPSTGAMLFHGVDVSTLDDDALSRLRGQSIGFIFQSFYLIPNMTVAENVELPLFYQREAPRLRRQRAHKCLELVGMTHRCDHKPNQLSGGERQRVSIARALVTDPDVLLADEPTGNLDSRRGAEIFDLFDQLRGSGKTLIVITHDLTVAQRFPRIVRIRDGQVERDGPA